MKPKDKNLRRGKEVEAEREGNRLEAMTRKKRLRLVERGC
jgi:hypothetical protein